MSYQVSLPIDAPAERVWAVLADVERWPESTASMTSVERLDSGPFRLGSRARIKQPSIPPIVWQVTEFDPPRGFTWCAAQPGVTTIADHVITLGRDHAVTVTLGIRRTGLLAPIVDLLYAGLTRRYVDMEIQGLKRVCEAGAVVSAM